MMSHLINRPLTFLQPTATFRELILLDEIEKNTRVTQSTLAKAARIVPAMVNNYIKDFIKSGYLTVEGNNRLMRYSLTVKGQKHKFDLLISYFREAVLLYKNVKEETKTKLRKIMDENVRRVVLYGAAETAEITINAAEEIDLEVIGVVDNDQKKQGRDFFGLVIQAPEKIEQFQPDAVIISSSGFPEELYEQIKAAYELKGIKVRKL